MPVAVLPPHFPRPKGYANGMIARGPSLYIAGQIGWEQDGRFATDDFIEQFEKALGYVLDIAKEAGCGPEDIVSMTIYVTELDAYRTRLQEVGAVWKARMGKNYPTMALVGVAGLVEAQAKVEIQAIAHIPEKGA